MTGGSVVLSLDAELMWGYHDHATLPTHKVERARESWLDLLDHFDEHDIPATWAVVGHLFLEECDGTHSDHPVGADWFSRDPGGRSTPDSYWFGRDLVDAILDQPVPHEVASHSFSHVVFGHSNTTADVAAAELRRSRAVAADYGVDVRSFCFPRDRVGHRGLLADNGFTCYRGNAPDRCYDGTRFRKPAKLATWALGAAAPPLVTPTVDEYGLVNVPKSLYLFCFEGVPNDVLRRVSTDPMVRQVELGLERLAKERDGIFHVQLHPNDIRDEADRHRTAEVVRLIGDYRDRYDITVETMAEVADRVRSDD
jgi:peptidoglycan/xylan/chitin deacetylase (PgdA/CDA1 family)